MGSSLPLIAVIVTLCIQVKVEAASPHQDWKELAKIFLCHSSGSDRQTARTLRKSLAQLFSPFYWYIVIGHDLRSSHLAETSEHSKLHDNLCSFGTFIWAGDKSATYESKCSKMKRARLLDLIKSVDNKDLGSKQVRNELVKKMRRDGFGFHFVFVADGYNRYSQSLSKKCFVRYKGDHQIHVFMK